MAISTSVTTEGGLTAPEGYLRVSDLQLRKVAGVHAMHFCVAFYADAQAASEGKEAICQPRPFADVPYDLAGSNPYVQAYDWLKTNVYPDATDLL